MGLLIFTIKFKPKLLAIDNLMDIALYLMWIVVLVIILLTAIQIEDMIESNTYSQPEIDGLERRNIAVIISIYLIIF